MLTTSTALAPDGGGRPVAWSGIEQAREFASMLGARSIGTQHVLLALLSGPEDDATRALRGAGVDLNAISLALDAVAGDVGAHPRVEPTTLYPSDRVLALLSDAHTRARHRTAESHEAQLDATVSDRDVLAALLDSDDESVATLVMNYIGARRSVLDQLRASSSPS